MRVHLFLFVGWITLTSVFADSKHIPGGNKPMDPSVDKQVVLAQSIPRPEHPNPQIVRSEWLNLNGPWEFAETNRDETERFLSDPAYPEKIIVPFCRESVLSGIHRKELVKNVWYRRKFSIPENWSSDRILLHVGACDWKTRVWVNQVFIGEHTGGSSPFSFDITSALKGDENSIIIHAYDDTGNGLQAHGKQAPDGVSRGCLYTPTTGIWQTVWLEGVGKSYIKNYQVDSRPREKEIKFKVDLDGPVKGLTLFASAYSEGKKVGTAKIFPKGNRVQFSMKLKEIHLWSPLNPFLYDLSLILKSDQSEIDQVQGYFGLRTISIDGTAILINGEPIFQRLILDQGFYPDGIWTAPSDEALRKDIQLSMNSGFNGARLHQKVFEPRFHYWADKLGYLTWGEYPNWGLEHSDPEIIPGVMNEWLDILERDRNHPSIIGWCPFNETLQSAGIIQQIVFSLTCSMDDSRALLETSGYTHTLKYPLVLDAHDYEQDPVEFKKHFPVNLDPGQFDGFKRGVAGLGEVPFFVSEYGGIGWDLSPDSWGYGNTPKSIEEFYFRFKGLTDVLLDDPRMFGLCYTQLTNVEQEKNGIYFYDRKPKFEVEKLHAIMSRKAAFESAPVSGQHSAVNEVRQGNYYSKRLNTFREERASLEKGCKVFIGDSLIQQFPIDETFKGQKVINRGILGDRIAGVANRLDVCVRDLEPESVGLMVGINNILWETASIEESGKEYQRLLKQLRRAAPNAKIQIFSILPVRARFAEKNKEICELNSMIQRMAKKEKLEYIDLHSRFTDSGGELRADLTFDGLHLNLSGYLLWLHSMLADDGEFLEAAMNLSGLWSGQSRTSYPIAKIDPPAEGDYPGSRGPNELILYTPGYEKSNTNTNEYGREAIIRKGVMEKQAVGNSPIPPDGYVVSGHGDAAQWIMNTLKPGMAVEQDSHLIRLSAHSKSGISFYQQSQLLKDEIFQILTRIKRSGDNESLKKQAGELLQKIMNAEATGALPDLKSLDEISEKVKAINK